MTGCPAFSQEDNDMSRILGISGSLRRGSYNSALLKAAIGLCPDLVQSASIHGIPLYDGDLEREEGCPAPVERLKSQILDADGVLLLTPEYNNSLPGVLKNAVDWLSRPSPGSDRIFRDKPVAVIGASMGGFGTVLGQNAWLPVFRALGARYWSGGRLMVARAQDVIDEQGMLHDSDMRDRLQKFIRDFNDFIG
jgi:NAD(P)H-dependent FMN reductase